MEQTIAAISTPPGVGGIAVVRISGCGAYDVASAVFAPVDTEKKLCTAKGYTALFGSFLFEGKPCDEGIALCFRAPHSYTGEDVVELSCHGGRRVSEQVLRACYDAGAAPAAPGEFTKRAFCNGRISLTQAEAVMDLIDANSRQAVGAAHAAMDGALYRRIHAVQTQLLSLKSHLAAYTDYPEEDVPELSEGAMLETLQSAQGALAALIKNYDAGAKIRRGVRTVIAGSPNVGKSTLLNLLAGFQRAIVTAVPGTTRDVVEQEISLGGVTLQLADTAGIRETQDIVEAEGIRRSTKELERADLILAVFDASRAVQPQDLIFAKSCAGKPAIAVLNKTDLPQQFDAAQLEAYFPCLVQGSAQSETFLPQLEQAISQVIGTAELDADAALLANERQLQAAKQAQAALRDAADALQQGYTLDAAGVCIDDALQALYALTGENATEDVINDVFSRFCVGK